MKKLKADNMESVINQQIADMKKYGIRFTDSQESYMISCLSLIWFSANIDGFREGCALWKNNTVRP